MTFDTKEFEACHQAVDRVLLEFNFLVQVNIEPSPSAQEISDEARKSLEGVLALSTKMIMDSMATVASDIQDEMRAMKSDLQSCLMEQLKQLDAKVDKVLIEVQGISAMFRNEVALKKIERVTVPEDHVILGSNLLGEGGFGRVITAKLLGEDVAAKSLTKEVTKESCSKLLDELLLHMDTSSTNIVKCFGICCKDGVSYILLQVCHCSLRQYIQEYGPLDWRLAVRITSSLCSGLLTLHGKNPPVIHRDVKLDNAMIATGGAVLLSDLGSARRQRVPSSTLSQSMGGTVGMTENYLPPEMHKKNAKATVKVDVYALVLVLYELCTGEVPYRPYSERPAIPADLPLPMEKLMQIGWAETPEDRPDMKGLFDALQRQLKALTQQETAKLTTDIEAMGLRAKQLAESKLRSKIDTATKAGNVNNQPAQPASPPRTIPGEVHSSSSDLGTATVFVHQMTLLKFVQLLKDQNFHSSITRYVEENEIYGITLLDRSMMTELDEELVRLKVPTLHVNRWHTFLRSVEQSAATMSK